MFFAESGRPTSFGHAIMGSGGTPTLASRRLLGRRFRDSTGDRSCSTASLALDLKEHLYKLGLRNGKQIWHYRCHKAGLRLSHEMAIEVQVAR
jgi:hypothetical protein